jgi:hypothetical protein
MFAFKRLSDDELDELDEEAAARDGPATVSTTAATA